MKCYVTFRLSTAETLIERLREGWYINSCLFCVKTSNKEEGMITLSRAPRCRQNGGVYTAICRATLKSAKTAFIVWISWKKMERFVRYTCLPNRKTRTENLRYEYVHVTPLLSLSIYIFHICKGSTHRILELRAQVHRDWDGRKPVLSLFYKSAMFCYCECTQINVESLQIWNMYYSYLYDQKSILRASDRIGTSICHAVSSLYSAYTPHRHLNSAHLC